MFKYFPHTKEDIKEMLNVIGVSSIDELLIDIPKEIRSNVNYNLGVPLGEYQLIKDMSKKANKNADLKVYRGAGAYDHYTPQMIYNLTSRSEFLTSYTPYQPEIAQGTLQYIFEFQSFITELTGMDIANASMYDGATATAEAMLMAVAETKKAKILISQTVNPETIKVVKTYAKYKDIEVVLIKDNLGTTSLDMIKEHSDYAGVIVQNPNYYGLIEDYSGFKDVINDNKGLFIINSDPQTLAVLKSPRSSGADIAVGDAQSLGIPLQFGGAYVGYLATTKNLVRKMPGRICGVTKDVDGKRAFVLTLQAREQHIRREKANSNICTNQSLMALWVTMYTSLMGKDGLVKVNEASYTNSHYLYEKLLSTGYFEKVYEGYFLKEFILKANFDINDLEEKMINKGYLIGLKIDNDKLLFAVTEKYDKEEIDEFVEVMLNELR